MSTTRATATRRRRTRVCWRMWAMASMSCKGAGLWTRTPSRCGQAMRPRLPLPATMKTKRIATTTMKTMPVPMKGTMQKVLKPVIPLRKTSATMATKHRLLRGQTMPENPKWRTRIPCQPTPRRWKSMSILVRLVVFRRAALQALLGMKPHSYPLSPISLGRLFVFEWCRQLDVSDDNHFKLVLMVGSCLPRCVCVCVLPHFSTRLLSNHSRQDKLTIISRIIVCHNIALSPQNKEKLDACFGLLIDYIVHVVDDGAEDEYLVLVDSLAPALFSVAQQVPDAAAAHVLRHVDRIEAETARMETLPGLSAVVVLQLIAHIFPTSDFRHPVVTPAALVVGMALSTRVLSSAENVCRGLALSSVALSYATPARRYYPEAITFLTAVLHTWNQVHDMTASRPKGYATATTEFLENMRAAHASTGDVSVDAMPLEWTVQCPAPLTFEWHVKVILHCLFLLERFAILYKDLPSRTAVFAHAAQQATLVLESKSLSTSLRDAGVSFLAVTVGGEASDEDAAPSTQTEYKTLSLQKHRPVPLAALEPDFQTYFTGRKTDPDKDRRELSKLKRQHKKEMKGAIRELRKDAKFIANTKLQEKRQFDAERNMVVKKYENQLASDLGQHRSDEKVRLKNKGKLRK
eukprot:m.450923 g.450923  ORF g.450923 m.450923 type:complete len:633 (+) comp21522_c0_seq2:1288-3186(+)